VELAPRRVHIEQIELLAYNYPQLSLVIDCGKGTYIRSLARDLGIRLGCGALVDSLRRTRVGRFTESAALPLDLDAETARARLLPLSAAVAELPVITLEPAEVARLRCGQKLPLSEAQRASLPEGIEEAAVFDPLGGLVAVARLDGTQHRLLPEKVMPAT
jgi:tRNA pseudouridine55 synthase